MEDFKIKGKHINKQEKEFLIKNGLRWCNICKKAHPKELFLESFKIRICKPCRQEKTRIDSVKYREKRLISRRKYKQENREFLKQQNREWVERTRPERREKYNKWRDQNKDLINEQKRRNYAKKNDHYKQYKKGYRESQKNNPLYQLAKRIRDRTYQFFHKKKTPKTKKTVEMLGCNWEELKAYIENQFTEGMSWDRLGEIHIDHIIPLASAKTEEELLKLAHYTNLQPLWAKENISKGAKIDY